MFGYAQSQQRWEIIYIIYTHCFQSYSEEVEYIADNRSSIGEAG